jgi:streptomycin 6-kinase
MNLNSRFASNIRDLYGEEGESWIKDLPSRLVQLAEKWDLRFLHVMPALTYNFVGLVERLSTGRTAILKMGPKRQNIEAEVQWFGCFNKGVPKIYWCDEQQNAFLMERFEPGYSLKRFVKAGNDDTATRIICQKILDLQFHQQKQAEFTHLSELVASLSVLKNHLDDRTLSQAISLFRELTIDRTQDVILHGDLHHNNILYDGSTWKVIDPHGYVGDPVFEVGTMIYNPANCFPHDRSIGQVVERRLHILTEELPFDPQRIKAWAICKTVLSIAWSFEDHATIPEFEAKVLSAITQMKV